MISITEVEKLPKVVKFLTTISVFWGCLTIANAVSFLSPALVELKNKYDTDIETMSRIFVIIPMSNLVGAVTGGLVYGKIIRRQHGTAICYLGLAIALVAVPHCSTLLQIYICVGCIGFFVGAYKTAEAVWLLEMWQKKSGPYLQAQHFMFALGTTLPPLILTPFLSDRKPDPEENLNLIPSNNESVSNHTEGGFEKIGIENSSGSNLYIPFAIAASISLGNFLYESFLICCYPYQKPRRESQGHLSLEKAKTDESKKSNAKWHKAKLITLTLFFIGFYMGGEICSIGFISAFSQFGGLHLSEVEAASALGALTGAFAFGRFSGIFITFAVPPHLILCGNMVLITGGSVVLLLWADLSVYVLWGGCALLGMGYSTIFASFLAFMERHLEFTDLIGSVILVGGSIVAMSYPIIVGKYIEENPQVFTYPNFLTAAVCSISLFVLYNYTKSRTVVK